MGGNRVGVAQANLAGQQALAQAPVIAGLYNQSYQQGLQTAQNQFQQNPLTAANAIANYGISGQGAALSGAGAQLGAGTLQQQTEQQRLNALYQQYQQAQAYPYQQTQWLAGIDTGVGSNLGGTSSGQTTAPAPNQWSQILGAGLTAASFIPSDRRVKEAVEKIGSTHDGQPLYRYRYKGSSDWHIGPMAQDVEKSHPDAVQEGVGGIKYVDLKAATDDAVQRAAGGAVQHLADGGVSGTPWSGGVGWIPSLQIHGGSGAPHASAPSAAQDPSFDPSKLAQGVSAIGGKLKGLGNISGDFGGSSGGGASASALGDATGLGGLYARGGGVVGYADGGAAADDPGIMERLARWSSEGRDQGQRAFYNQTRAGLFNSETSPEHGSTYGGLGHGLDTRRQLQAYEALDIADKVRGRKKYADGGAPDFSDRFAPAEDQPLGEMTRGQGIALASKAQEPVQSRGVAPVDDVVNPGDPIRLPDEKAVQDWRNSTPLPGVAGTPPVAAKDDSEEEAPVNATPTSGAGVAPAAAYKPPYEITPADYMPPAKAPEDTGWLSKNARIGLLTAGLGMLANRSPFLGTAIGQGGLAGLAAYGSAEERDRKAAEDAQKLSLEAKQAANTLAHQTFQTNEAARHNLATERQAAVNADRTKFVPAGTILTPDGGVHPVVLDQNTGKMLDATTGKPPSLQDKMVGKNDKGPQVSDEDAKAVAMRYVKTGDRTQLQGLGISGSARQKVNHYIGVVQKELGISDEELGTRVAEWEGRKAGQRVLGTQEAKMGSAAMEAEGAIKQARGVIERLPRTSFLPLNKLIQGYQTNSLNPDQAELYGRTQAIVNTYSAVMARGANVTTDSARGHAEALLNTAGDPATYNRMLDTMLQEIEMAKHSPARMREFYRQQYGPQAAPAEPGSAAAPTTAPVNGGAAVGPSTSPDGTSKTIGGKSYVTRNGQWWPQ